MRKYGKFAKDCQDDMRFIICHRMMGKCHEPMFGKKVEKAGGFHQGSKNQKGQTPWQAKEFIVSNKPSSTFPTGYRA
jgi:hypothetical protein